MGWKPEALCVPLFFLERSSPSADRSRELRDGPEQPGFDLVLHRTTPTTVIISAFMKRLLYTRSSLLLLSR